MDNGDAYVGPRKGLLLLLLPVHVLDLRLRLRLRLRLLTRGRGLAAYPCREAPSLLFPRGVYG